MVKIKEYKFKRFFIWFSGSIHKLDFYVMPALVLHHAFKYQIFSVQFLWLNSVFTVGFGWNKLFTK